MQWIEKERNMPKKLNRYYEYVKKILEKHTYLSAAQVEDRLKEEFEDLPEVHSKTVYNFVQSIREKHCIRKNGKRNQEYMRNYQNSHMDIRHRQTLESIMIQTKEETRKKVYFFTMVLCRSRHKYVYFQTHPFTTDATIEAHEKALALF